MTAERCETCDHNEKTLAELGPGPWTGEPHRVQFEHARLPCIVHRGGVGSWCGYVGVATGHPVYRKVYDDVEVAVHGGLTYAESCAGHICHVPKLGEPDDLWWLGFDCGHFMDLSPGLLATEKRYGLLPMIPHGHYWTVAEAMEETRRLADQLAAMAFTPEPAA